MSPATETLQFEAEVKEVLDLMIHSLYTNREIFLRELISNASDALDRARFAALTESGLLGEDDRLHVRLDVDREARTLTIADNGIGMTREEVVSNLGTIARSGTKGFMKALADEKAGNAPELIGQFGVGFYSGFMVADEVTVETRSAHSDQAWRWRSRGAGEYELEEIDRAQRGTSITLHMREEQESEDGAPRDFLAEYTLREIVRRYSDFVEYPIELEVTRTQPVLDDEGNPKEGETETVTSVDTLNSMRPLWARDKSDISDEEYAEFYKHLTHDWTDPHDSIHFKAEGTLEFTALLYIPGKRPFDLFDGSKREAEMSLYVKRVFITSECTELLPPWMRFVKGVVDSSDLPLNISRETFQENRVLRQIRKRLVSKVLDALAYELKSDREAYEAFWVEFGQLLKEGIIVGDDTDEKLAKLLLCDSTWEGEGLSTLEEYVARMPEGQEAIYVLTGPDPHALSTSPHLELLAEKGFEVLLLSDPADEWLVDRLRTFDGKPVKQIDKGDLGLETEEEKEAQKEQQEQVQGLCDTMQILLADHVKEVRLSSRLKESPAVLVTDEHDMSPGMQRILERANQAAPKAKRILELNPEHALFARLKSLYDDDTQSPKLAGFSDLLLGQALLHEGSELPDPARFAKLVTELMVGG